MVSAGPAGEGSCEGQEGGVKGHVHEGHRYYGGRTGWDWGGGEDGRVRVGGWWRWEGGEEGGYCFDEVIFPLWLPGR